MRFDDLNAILNSTLEPLERLVLVAVASHINSDGAKAWPSIERLAQMTGLDAMRRCFDAVTEHPARVLGLDGYGLAVGRRADLVLLQARSPEEAIRLRAARLMTVRGGRVLARGAPQAVALDLPGRPRSVDFTRQPPR